MNKKYALSLFIFRRDLRLYDNTALNEALKLSDAVIPCFIFDERQIGNKNPYKSNNAIQFMIESLENIQQELSMHNGKLYFFYGIAEDIVLNIIQNIPLQALFINRDYTPFSRLRDKALAKICSNYSIDYNVYDDALLTPPEAIRKKDGSHYSIFSAFYKKASVEHIREPEKIYAQNWFTKPLPNTQPKTFITSLLKNKNTHNYVTGGSDKGTLILDNLTGLKNYTKTRDFPFLKTSQLSAHLKFGTLSIRHVYYAIQEKLGKTHALLRQLYWRDFFTHIAYHKPTVFGHPYHEQYEKLPWITDKEMFEKWCNGITGFPIVDAGMRQLNNTGFMHNRIRMIVASFLVKDLHINWLWGERYFAQKLTDYDPALNNGNWQWCASTGCDSQPYFRIFNPWLQQKKFDPECVYIKQWIPELKNYEPQIIHNWCKHNSPDVPNYPRPILDHSTQATRAKQLYKKASR